MKSAGQPRPLRTISSAVHSKMANLLPSRPVIATNGKQLHGRKEDIKLQDEKKEVDARLQCDQANENAAMQQMNLQQALTARRNEAVLAQAMTHEADTVMQPYLSYKPATRMI